MFIPSLLEICVQQKIVQYAYKLKKYGNIEEVQPVLPIDMWDKIKFFGEEVKHNCNPPYSKYGYSTTTRYNNWLCWNCGERNTKYECSKKGCPLKICFKCVYRDGFGCINWHFVNRILTRTIDDFMA